MEKGGAVSRTTEELAVLGGPKAVTAEVKDWPHIDDAITGAVVRVLREENLSPLARRGVQAEFEDAFARYHRRRFALGLNSGSAALPSAQCRFVEGKFGRGLAFFAEGGAK